MKKSCKKNIPGFTLIEIMLVVIIIGALSAMVIPRLSGRSDQAKRTAAQADIEAHLATALKLYDLDKDGTEKRLDYERIFKILKMADYRGYLSVEFEGEDDEFSAMKRGCAYLRKMMLSLSV